MLILDVLVLSQQLCVFLLRRDTIWKRGRPLIHEGTIYLSSICDHFQSYLNYLWGRGCLGLGGGMKMQSFASVHLSVCLYRAGAQKPYLELLRGKE